MKKLLVLLMVSAGVSICKAQTSYAVFFIDTSLIKGANVVVRNEEERYELKSVEKAVRYYKRAITILNEEGDRHADVVVHYDRFTSIDYIDGALYDAFGKKIRSLKKGDIKDQVYADGISLAADNRYKTHNFYHKVYPYTVEYEYAVIDKGTMHFPHWYPQTSPFYSVEQSNFTLIVPASYQPRYKAFNYAAEPQVTQKGDQKQYRWEIKKLPVTRMLFGFPGWRHVAPMVILGPSDFEIANYKGAMSSWGDFGKFMTVLNEGRDVLPEDVRRKVHELADGKPDTKGKIEVLYDFLQKNTRYISIQLGIGGWQPFDASYVAKNRYGDCKALSNYMYALLKEAGINSHYTLVRAGDNEEDIVTDFPSNQFNHAILCVPLEKEKDTMWLECTSQTQVPGYMSEFTGNRHALLITPEGGKLVPTPRYGITENRESRTVKAFLQNNGNLEVQQLGRYSGILQDTYQDYIVNSVSKEKVKEYLNSTIDLPTFDIVDYKYDHERSKVPVVNEQLKFNVSNYAQVSGKRIFVVPNIANRAGLKLTPEDRKYPIKLKNAYVETDTVEISVPPGYSPEAMPNTLSVESKFGKYNATFRFENNKVIYHRRMERYNGVFEHTLYPELIKFYEQIYKADRSRVVLVKNE